MSKDELIRGKIKVEWVDCGEGLSGDYDPDDPEDIALLRFDISRLVDSDWEPIDDASYCTMMPVDTSDEAKIESLEYLMDEIYEPASAVHSIKKLCERLSWINPDWLKERRSV